MTKKKKVIFKTSTNKFQKRNKERNLIVLPS